MCHNTVLSVPLLAALSGASASSTSRTEGQSSISRLGEEYVYGSRDVHVIKFLYLGCSFLNDRKYYWLYDYCLDFFHQITQNVYYLLLQRKGQLFQSLLA